MTTSNKALLTKALEIEPKFAKHVTRSFLIETACKRFGIFDRKEIRDRVEEVLPLWDDLPEDADASFVECGMTAAEIDEAFRERQRELA